jgi:hypothetical protein
MARRARAASAHVSAWLEGLARRGAGNLTQCLLERLHGLTTLNQILVVDDDGRNGVDSSLAVKLFALRTSSA